MDSKEVKFYECELGYKRTNKRTNKRRENGIGKNTRKKIFVLGKHLILRMLKLQK